MADRQVSWAKRSRGFDDLRWLARRRFQPKVTGVVRSGARHSARRLG